MSLPRKGRVRAAADLLRFAAGVDAGGVQVAVARGREALEEGDGHGVRHSRRRLALAIQL